MQEKGKKDPKFSTIPTWEVSLRVLVPARLLPLIASPTTSLKCTLCSFSACIIVIIRYDAVPIEALVYECINVGERVA